MEVPLRPISLEQTAHDPELLAFFDDYGDCSNLLGEIDREIVKLTQAYYSGHRLTGSELNLLMMTIYANPVDAVKYFLYRYQTYSIAHRDAGVHSLFNHLILRAPLIFHSDTWSFGQTRTPPYL